MTVQRTSRYLNNDEQIYGDAADDRIEGGRGSDFLIGNAGADTFVFRRGDGHDYVVDFQQGEDKLEVHSSIRQVSMRDTDFGTEVYYCAFGQNGPDHFTVWGVHHLTLNDFVF